MCFGSVLGPFRGVGWCGGGVGKRGFCKGENTTTLNFEYGLRGWDLQRLKLKGILTKENQGNALRQDFALYVECESKVLISHSNN